MGIKHFNGIWATFQQLDDTCAVVKALHQNNFHQILVHSPIADTGIENLNHRSTNPIKIISFGGAILGSIISVWLIVRMSLEWIQPLSAKPIVSYLTIIPVAFELSILCTVAFTVIGMVAMAVKDRHSFPLPRSSKYRDYKRFTRDRFGVVVCSESERIPEVKKLFFDHQAEEIHIEN